MRISTSQIFQQAINQITRQQSKVSTIQNMIATGKRINTASDDPIGASQAILLKEQIARSDAFQGNVETARGALGLEESALKKAGNILERIRELQIQANSSILNSSDRSSISTEMNNRLEELEGIANIQDASGAYMFSGFKAGTLPFTKNSAGTYLYNGDDGEKFLEVSSGLNVQMSDSGFDVFENIKSGTGDIQFTDLGATNTGTGVVNNYEVSDRTSFVKENYTLTFVTNSSGNLAYQVVGSTSGQLIPTLPATTPANAPDFVAGQSMTFNGIQVTVDGLPIAGDDFQFVPSTGQNVFTSIQNSIATLALDNDTAAENAVFRNQMNQNLHDLDRALERITEVRTELGARLNTLDDAESINTDFKLHSESLLSTIEDLDYAQGITDLNKNMLGLQAAQQSFVRIQGLSLFAIL